MNASGNQTQTLLTGLFISAAIPFLLFLPYVLSRVEHRLFGTEFVEEIARTTGAFDFLDWLYDLFIYECSIGWLYLTGKVFQKMSP